MRRNGVTFLVMQQCGHVRIVDMKTKKNQLCAKPAAPPGSKPKLKKQKMNSGKNLTPNIDEK